MKSCQKLQCAQVVPVSAHVVPMISPSSAQVIPNGKKCRHSPEVIPQWCPSSPQVIISAAKWCLLGNNMARSLLELRERVLWSLLEVVIGIRFIRIPFASFE